ncbi:MDR family MFS transporter [Streptomyces iconiensis]|uniref:DHA2 family efflux MFS transporter permease subunit n=1 Tax=Streptomyces iconiensis TaxID=1384038 RepID=A0ABT7A0J4_9ACTN|nr:MDR family MFS transporter [Streptomyces iconiensis]MDJ1134574.1 DHA2 family efflux MFS transporter permease subunit [Streptomyces iconiensis]
MPGTQDPRRWWALVALGACMLTLGFDLTILNVALPEMAGQLHADTGDMQWIVDAYVVVFAATMLPAGLLGDRYGRRRMLVAGLGVFFVGSLLGTLADSPAWVIAARAGMGLGAALISPLVLSVLPSLFPDEKERTKAIGAVTAAVAGGMPLGPIVGGWLLDHYWWGSVFLINVPLAALGILACVLLLPESRDPAAPRVDPLGTLLGIAGLGSLVYAIIEGPVRGWSDPLVVGLFPASVLLMAALVLRERRAGRKRGTRPMLDLDLLRSPGFRWSCLSVTLVTLVLSGLLFIVPQYLQAVLGHDALGTGLRLLPLMAGVVVAARVAPPLSGRFGARLVISAGLVVLAFAAFLGARTEPGDGYALAATWLTITGLGTGLAMVPGMDAALTSLPADRTGSGSGLLMTVRQMGTALGIALLGSLLSQVYGSRLDLGALPDGLPARAADSAGDSVVAAHLLADKFDAPRLAASADAAFLDGMSQVLMVCGGGALVGAVVVGALLRGVGRGAGVGGGAGVGTGSADVPSGGTGFADGPPADVPSADGSSADAGFAGLPPADVPSADAGSADVPPAGAGSADVPSGGAPPADAGSADVPSGGAPPADAGSADVPSADANRPSSVRREGDADMASREGDARQ